MRLIFISIIFASIALAHDHGSEQFQGQNTCAYWIRHFTALETAEIKLRELRAAGAHPFVIWLARRKLKRVFLKQQWDAFGEMVDEAERIFPDNEDDENLPWSERPRFK